MKRLLTNAQALVRERLPYVRDIDVYITSDENFIPKGTQFPAVGIKDGNIKNTDLMGGQERDRVLDIKLIPYIKRYDEEETVMGKGEAKGILDISADLHDALENNFLDIPGMEEVSCPEEKESQSFGEPGDGLTRKIITYRYELRE